MRRAFVCVYFFHWKIAYKLLQDDSLLLFKGHLDFLLNFRIALFDLFDVLVVLVLFLLEFWLLHFFGFFDSQTHVVNAPFQSRTIFLKFSDFCVLNLFKRYHFLFFLIGFDDAPHAVINAAFVQVFIGFDLISVLVSNSDQKETSLPAVDGNLSDDFIETLVVQFLPDRTKANFPGLFWNQSLVQLFA